MNIAFHISEDDLYEFGINFNLQVAVNLARAHAENHYILISDHAFDYPALPENCTTVLTGPAIKNRLSNYYWYTFKLPAVLKKYNADIFIPQHNCFNGSLKLKQLYVIQQNPAGKSFIRQQHKDLAKAAAILHITKSYIPSSKFTDKVFEVPYDMPEVFHPYNFIEKEAVKKQHSHDNDYFFAIIRPGQESFSKTLLKAFSHFKKWQKSSLKLIILTEQLGIPDFHLYKFREDVEIKYVQQTSIKERAALLASSYCNMLMNEKDLISSVKCGSPSILVGDKENLFDDAALYATADEKSLSKQMILVYKDEYLRNQLIREAGSLAQIYTWQNAADIVYKAISSIQ